jgi:hypothetical protein
MGVVGPPSGPGHLPAAAHQASHNHMVTCKAARGQVWGLYGSPVPHNLCALHTSTHWCRMWCAPASSSWFTALQQAGSCPASSCGCYQTLHKEEATGCSAVVCAAVGGWVVARAQFARAHFVQPPDMFMPWSGTHQGASLLMLPLSQVRLGALLAPLQCAHAHGGVQCAVGVRLPACMHYLQHSRVHYCKAHACS